MQQSELILNQSPQIYTPPSVGARPAFAGRHVPALDGLRGIAILLVMLNHFTFYGGMKPATVIDRAFYMVAVSGWAGVDLFFVLSGFLITGILYDTKENAHYFRNFYARRFVRIFPLYYGSLFFLFILLPRLTSLGPEFQSLLKGQIWYWSYLINFRIALHDWTPFGIIDHFWSLAVEEQFYLLWPVIVFLLSRRNLMIICLACIVTSLGVRVGLILAGYPTATNVLTLARMDSLAVGAFLALMARDPSGLSGFKRWVFPLVGFAASALVVIFVWRQGLHSDDQVTQTIGYSFLALLFGAILTFAITRAPGTTLNNLFSSPALRFFGRYSYALYVFHQPIVFYLKEHNVSVETFPRILGLQLPGQILFIILATGVSLGLALLSWYLYEQPFLKLKRLFLYEHETKTSNGFEISVARRIAP